MTRLRAGAVTLADAEVVPTMELAAAWGEPEGNGPLVRAMDAAAVADLEQAAALGAGGSAHLRAGGAH